MKSTRYIFAILISVAAISDLLPQVGYSFSGYINDLPDYSVYNNDLINNSGIDKNQFLNLLRVRLRPEIYLWTNGRVNIEYEADALYSSQGLSSFTPGAFINQSSTNRQIFNLKWNLINGNNFNVSHYIDRLYFRQGFSWGNIIIGRQRIAWGVGRIWRPTDLFNPLNPANFGKIEKDGTDAASVTYSFGNFTDINAVFNPQEKIGGSNAGFRFRTNYDEYDLAVVGGYFDQRITAGGDFAGNLFKAGFRGEGIISMDKNNLRSNYVKLVFGIDNQFTSKLYALIEYQFNGEGAADKSDYDLLGLSAGRIINLSRNYIVLSSSYQVTPIFAASLANSSNLNDGSGYINLTGNYSLSDNSVLTLGGLFPYGGKLTEYKYYPPSIYLQGQMFF